jgi:hypothetical protein
VVLGLNPGFKDVDRTHHRDARFAELSRGNLLHEEAAYPFYLLDPTIKRTKYWERKLRRLIDRFGSSLVARKVLCVEFFPYHSKRFKPSKLALLSQQYSFSLVSRAIKRGAVILQMRGDRYWSRKFPELATYPQLYKPNSIQNPTVSPRNFPKGFDAAVTALSRA